MHHVRVLGRSSLPLISGFRNNARTRNAFQRKRTLQGVHAAAMPTQLIEMMRHFCLVEVQMRKFLCFTAAVSLGATGAVAANANHFAGSNLLPLARSEEH